MAHKYFYNWDMGEIYSGRTGSFSPRSSPFTPGLTNKFSFIYVEPNGKWLMKFYHFSPPHTQKNEQKKKTKSNLLITISNEKILLH